MITLSILSVQHSGLDQPSLLDYSSTPKKQRRLRKNTASTATAQDQYIAESFGDQSPLLLATVESSSMDESQHNEPQYTDHEPRGRLPRDGQRPHSGGNVASLSQPPCNDTSVVEADVPHGGADLSTRGGNLGEEDSSFSLDIDRDRGGKGTAINGSHRFDFKSSDLPVSNHGEGSRRIKGELDTAENKVGYQEEVESSSGRGVDGKLRPIRIRSRAEAQANQHQHQHRQQYQQSSRFNGNPNDNKNMVMTTSIGYEHVGPKVHSRRSPRQTPPGDVSMTSDFGPASRWGELSKAHVEFHRLGTAGE